MKLNNRKGNHRTMWRFIYVITFILVFVLSAIFKMTYNPLANNYEIIWDDTVGRVYTDIAYGKEEQNKFDLYLPADNRKKTYGLVVYLHAGGFTSGDKSDDEDILKRFCAKGYVAVGINYTLRTEDNKADVYTMSMDIRNSIPIVVKEAKKRGYKLDRMAMSGGSAGGTLALLYAYRDAKDAPMPMKMVFEMVGPASFYPKDWYNLDTDKDATASFFSVLAGKSITSDMINTEEYEEVIKDISPYMWINKNSVPTLVAYGKYDKICPFGTVKYLIDALEKNNVPYDYIEFPHSGHGLQNDNQLYLDYMKKMDEYLNKYLN